MARVYTEMPAHQGELRLARQLQAMPDRLLHLWFGLNMVPRVNDIDIFMWHEAAGIFVIEVKAVPLNAMRSFAWTRCEIENRGSSKSPHLQAAEARDSLLDFLAPEIRKRLFIVATACWLEEFSKRASLKQLRRNFRNTMPVFQLAHVFYEAALEFEKINDVIPRFKKDPRTGQLPLFERPAGELPQFREVDDATLPWNQADSPWFADAQYELMVSHYRDIIQEQLDDLSDRERPIDILILVPRPNSMEREWAVTALQGAGVRYTDYTEDANRRQSARSDAVRLCTYHSARGLEGGRVVVLGFETIDRLAEATNTDLAHLGYTVLSRSLFECLLVRRSTGSQMKPMRFISEALDALRKVE